MSSDRSATIFFKRLFSSSSSRNRRISDGIIPAYFFFQLKYVAWLIPAWRQISATAVPCSPCLIMNAFCASENLDAFIFFHSFPAKKSKVENSKQKRSDSLGANQIDIATAKSYHDQGVTFLDVSDNDTWNEGHITGAVHLSWIRTEDPRFSKTTLRDIAGYNHDIVFYASDGYLSPAWEVAKAVTWGYRRLYHFEGGAPAWEAAGYPVKTGQKNNCI